MLPVLWVIVWVAVFLAPFPPCLIRNKWRHLLFAVFGTVCAFICLAAAVIDCHMVLLLVLFRMLLVSVELWLGCDLQDDRYSWKKPRRAIYRFAYAVSLIATIALNATFYWQVFAASRVNNAVAFNNAIMFQNVSVPVFAKEVQDNLLRLTTEELAKSIALRNAARFGSVKAGSAHIALYKGRLVWVVTILPPNLLGDNTIKGFVIVDANDPEADVEIVSKTFHVGEDLIYLPPFYTGEIRGNAYWSISTADMYGRAFPALDGTGEWKYVLTVTGMEPWSFVERPRGVYVFNEYGLEKFYAIEEMPEWVTQCYDEGWIERMVDCWGKHRRGDGFDLWSGGFFWIPASTNRVEISDDTRWILDPDLNEVVAVVAVDPVGEVQTMAGMFKITRKGVFYYDLSPLGLKSGLQAQNVVGAHLTKPATGAFEPQMPMLYTVGGRYAWFVPIYWHITGEEALSEQETIKLVGLAVVDAVNLDHFSMVMTGEGYTGASLVAEAKRRFLGGASVAEVTVSGTLEAKFSYVSNGNTVYVLTIDGTCYKVDTGNLDFRTVSRIEGLQVGERVTIIVNANDEFVCFPD